jgi:hypothetical protein
LFPFYYGEPDAPLAGLHHLTNRIQAKLKINSTMKLEYSVVKSAARKLKFRTQAFIDGKFVNAQNGKTFTTENPATGQPLAQVAACDTSDIDCAVKAARRVFEAGPGLG